MRQQLGARARILIGVVALVAIPGYPTTLGRHRASSCSCTRTKRPSAVSPYIVELTARGIGRVFSPSNRSILQTADHVALMAETRWKGSTDTMMTVGHYPCRRASRRRTSLIVMKSHIKAAAENTAGPKIADPVDVVTDVPERSKSRAPTASHNSVRSAALAVSIRRESRPQARWRRGRHLAATSCGHSEGPHIRRRWSAAPRSRPSRSGLRPWSALSHRGYRRPDLFMFRCRVLMISLVLVPRGEPGQFGD